MNTKKIIIDLDDTITINNSHISYENKIPRLDVLKKLIEYKSLGFEIVIFSSRNMNTFDGSLGKINIHTLPTILNWLKQYGIPHDQVLIGKPWCGEGGFYVDDRAIRPSEFTHMSYQQIQALLVGD